MARFTFVIVAFAAVLALVPAAQPGVLVVAASNRGLVGAVKTTETVIYFLDEGARGAAERLRADLELPDVEIALFEGAPPVAGRNDAQLMVYLGGA